MSEYDELIGDVLNLEKLGERWHKPEDFFGVVLVLKDAQLRVGQNGEFYVLTCDVEASGETVYVSTGASQPMLVVQAWRQQGRRPVRFTFLKEGRRTIMDNPLMK